MTSPDLVRIELPGVWDGMPPDRPSDAGLAGWFFSQLTVRDPVLAEELRGLGQLWPYTLGVHGRISPCLVVTGFGPLASFVQELHADPPDQMVIDGRCWRRAGAPNLSLATWSDLASPLLAPLPQIRARLMFITPTTFRDGRAYTPLPVPRLVVGSLLERWQRWANIRLDPSAEQAIADHIVLRRFVVRSVLVRVPMFMGWAEWLMRPSSPAEYAGLLAVLAAFAEFAGVGHDVQRGFGHVRQLRDWRPPELTDSDADL